MTQKILLNVLKNDLINSKKPLSRIKKTFSSFSAPKKKTCSNKKNIFDIIKKDHDQDSIENLKLTTSSSQTLAFENKGALTEKMSTLSSQLIQAKEALSQVIDSIYSECKNGVSTTTITIKSDDPASIFTHSDILIEHYDTAPQSFNVQLSGSLQAVNAFNTHLQALQMHLDQRLPSVQIQLLTPILKETQKAKSTERGQNVRKKKMGTEKKLLPKL